MENDLNRNCRNCNSIFKLKYSISNKKFCCFSCNREYALKTRYSEIICAICGKKQLRIKSRTKQDRMYCSSECRRIGFKIFDSKRVVDYVKNNKGNLGLRGKAKNNNGYYNYSGKLVHRIAYEKLIGRCLRPDEVLHHIDQDKLNNDLKNLYLCSKSGHMELHRKLDKVVSDLIKMNYIKFKDGNYYTDLM